MTTELRFHDKKIPVTFISSDQKAIPQLISVLEGRKNLSSSALPCIDRILRIEVVGNEAVLHTAAEHEKIQLPLF